MKAYFPILIILGCILLVVGLLLWYESRNFESIRSANLRKAREAKKDKRNDTIKHAGLKEQVDKIESEIENNKDE